MGRLDESSSAVRLLCKNFRENKYTFDDKPKSVWSSSDEFQKYPLANFSTIFNKLKREYLGSFQFSDGHEFLKHTSHT